MVDKLADLFGATRNTATVSGDDRTNWRPAFTLPSDLDKNDFWIVYYFQGRDPNNDVEVYGRPWWFLSDDDGDGLIWPFQGFGKPALASIRAPVAAATASSNTTDGGVDSSQDVDNDHGIFGIVSATLYPGTLVILSILPYLRTHRG